MSRTVSRAPVRTRTIELFIPNECGLASAAAQVRRAGWRGYFFGLAGLVFLAFGFVLAFGSTTASGPG
jgi:hypothetical protein